MKPGQQRIEIEPGGDAGGPAAIRRRRGGVNGFFDRLDLFQGMKISGSNTLTLQQNSVQGSESAYEGQRWDTGGLVQQSSLHLEGPLWKELRFQADISDSGWGQSYSRMVYGYVGHDTALVFGDLDLQLGGNEFVGFRKSTNGWQIDQRLPNDGFMRGFYTSEKGLTRNQTFVGNDTPGPYFLTFTPVIEGTEVIKVNEEFMTRGEDYRLDYDTGQLYFEPLDGEPRIISAADTVSVSYQSVGYQGNGAGTIYGLRAEMPLMNDRLLVGLSTLQRDTGASGSAQDTVGYQEDVYNGSGSTGPFDTNYRPVIADGASVVFGGATKIIDKALVVMVDAVEQRESVDYDAYRSIGRVIFRRIVPPTALVVIKYYYDLDNENATGDQSIWGVDLGYRLGKGSNMTLDWASSSDNGTGDQGSALSAMMDYSRGSLRLMGEYRNIEPTYTFMDSVGFKRQEKGINLGGEWQVMDGLTITDRFADMNGSSGLSFGYSGYGGGSDYSSYSSALGVGTRATTTGLSVATQRNDLGVRYNRRGWPDLSFNRVTMSNAGGSSGATSDYGTNTWRVNYAPTNAKYTIRIGLTQSTQSSQAVGTTADETPTVSGSNSDQLQTTITWNPFRALNLSASFSNNKSAALESTNRSSSANTMLTASWRPSDRFGIDYNRSLSSADGRVSSGYYNSYSSLSAVRAYASPGGGDSGGDGEDDDETPSSNDSNDRLSINWRPSDRVSFDFSVGKRGYRSTGSQGYLADSDQNTWNLGAVWQMSNALALNLALGADDMAFLDADRGAVSNQSFILGLGFRPPESKWGGGITLNLQDGASPTYTGSGRLQRYEMVPTSLFDLNGQVSYNLNRDLVLTASVGTSDFSGGYADFKKLNGEMRVRYLLSGTTGIDFGYRFIRNISQLGEDSDYYSVSAGNQNYLASTFLLAITTNFQGGIGGGGNNPLGSGYFTGGYGGGPGTFAGYNAGLGNSYQSGSYGPSGYRSGGSGSTGYGSSGFGSSGYGNSRFGTGYGPSAFDQIGNGFGSVQQGDIYGGSSPFAPGAADRGGDLTGGIGEFKRRDRSQGDFGGIGSGGGPRIEDRRPAGGAPPVGSTEDWWLLDDNMAHW